MSDPAPIFRVHPPGEPFIIAAAARIAEIAAQAVRARGRFSLALSGGSTPGAIYRHLARHAREQIEWPATHVWWGDERCVPHDHKDSNTRAAREALLDHVPIPAANVHLVPTHLAPDACAAEYERELRAFDRRTPLDLTLLGLGADGHTASLFPGGTALAERDQWVVHTAAPPASPVRDRVSFTLPLIGSSRRAVFLVTGAEKRDVVRRVLAARAGDPLLPASLVRARDPVEWLVDSGAAPDEHAA